MPGPESHLLRFEDLAEGRSYHEEVQITEDLLQAFVAVSGDHAPAHCVSEHAQRMGFPERIVHGLLVGLPYSRMLGMHLPGGNTVIQTLRLDMIAPVFVGDTLTYSVAVERIMPSVRAAILALGATNQRGERVSRGSATCVFRS